ncbi:FKBP-type peptidyl-prolyl cis-trans isomerase [Dactylosporangium sp. NPDC051485]|uniref:FKBP-type peptidyl-prolyl cis-trans isomerase n=1 Tax=Dactylosporangium sp. NPDC051485 TaxID=3154846 RepID=UPI0034321312
MNERMRTATPKRPSGEPPALTKADKRALAKAAKARAVRAAKIRQGLTIAGSAVAVLAIVVALALWGPFGDSAPSSSTASAAAEATTAAAPTTAAFPPLPPDADPALSKKPEVKAGGGSVTSLVVHTEVEGKGEATKAGQTITVNYVGVNYADGKQFDASWDHSQAFSFQLGAGRVIKGWDQGLVGVKVGSRVQLDIPVALAYGDNPQPGQPQGSLRFVVDVLAAS